MASNNKETSKELRLLIAIDFSDCARGVLRQAKLLLSEKHAHIIALHVIDHDFIAECIRHKLDDEGEIKKKLFMEAKAKLKDFLSQENIGEEHVKRIGIEGVPFIECGYGHYRKLRKDRRYERNIFWKHNGESIKVHHAAGALRPPEVRVPDGLTTIIHRFSLRSIRAKIGLIIFRRWYIY